MSVVGLYRMAGTIGGVVLALAAASPVHAQDRWEQQVRTQLERAGTLTGNSGYVQTHGPWIQSLRAGQNQSWSVRLEGGVEYRIVGVCDNDCRDFDLKLVSGGTTVAQDVAVDDVPIVTFTPAVTREYNLQAVMVTCSVNPCRYGVAAYGRRSAGATTSTSASTQDRWQQQVMAQLDRAGNITGGSGYVQTHGPWLASLRTGENQAWSVRLNAGATYRIVGVCDNDCSDLDLKLLAGSTSVAQDVAVDDVPVLTFTPTVTGDYTLQIIMATCSVNPCRFGVAAYGR